MRDQGPTTLRPGTNQTLLLFRPGSNRRQACPSRQFHLPTRSPRGDGPHHCPRASHIPIPSCGPPLRGAACLSLSIGHQASRAAGLVLPPSALLQGPEERARRHEFIPTLLPRPPDPDPDSPSDPAAPSATAGRTGLDQLAVPAPDDGRLCGPNVAAHAHSRACPVRASSSDLPDCSPCP